MGSPPQGTVAFLFTDIEGSTRLWQEHAPGMQAATARHDAILRQAVTGQGGVVYKVVGDAIQAAVSTVPGAVTAALAAQRALTAEDWAHHGLGEALLVRMALHVGAVDPDADGDYRSPVLNRLGRLLAAGHGGQVLLSQATAELARDHLPDGASLIDLGEQHLKDLGRPERIWQLVHPDLPSEFPPLVAMDRRRHNLPMQPTPLIGREQEVAQVVTLLQRKDVRLLTLTGPGGTGKTRLGLQVAAELLEEYPDGVWFVNLSALTDPALVLPTLAAVLGVQEVGGQALIDTLVGTLVNKHLLVVLDNVEQVVEVAPDVAALLGSCAGLMVLATSRVPLRLQGEREVAVPPLALPDPQQLPDLAKLTQYESVRLFIERAQAVRADFEVTNTTAPAVAEICHRLDGLPLAIELAAARIRLLSPQAMLSRLEKRLPLLTGGARDLPLRQQTLRNTIAWSYNLLPVDEQRLFRLLSVFRGGWTLEAATEVTGAGEIEVLDGLERLVTSSLVTQREEDDGESRFGMLETIRDFGLEQLNASTEADAINRQHAAFFLQLAADANDGLRGAEMADWLVRLEGELDNIRAALRWMIDRRSHVALDLASRLERFWWLRGHLHEGGDWLARTLRVADKADSVGRANALRVAAILTLDRGDSDGATVLAHEALRVAEAIGDDVCAWGARNTLGEIAATEGRFPDSLSLFEVNIERARELGDSVRLLGASANAGMAAYYVGNRAYARQLHLGALELARKIGDAWSIANCLSNLGALALDDGAPELALELFGESLGIARDLQSQYALVQLLEGVSMAAVLRKHAETAAVLLSSAASMRERISYPVRPMDVDEHQRHIDLVMGQLTKEQWQAAWATGQTLTFDAAVDEAQKYARLTDP